MLTPEEIQSREFLVSLRGYDRDEVHAFLDEVADAFSQLLASDGDGEGASAAPPADAATAEVAPPAAAPAADATVSPFAAIGAETQRILEAAQEVGDQIRARAESEAAQARDAAIADAEAEVAVLQERAAEAQRQIDVLELRRDAIADRLRQARETAEMALRELAEDEADVIAVEDDLVASVDVADAVVAPEDAGAAEDDVAEAPGGVVSTEPLGTGDLSLLDETDAVADAADGKVDAGEEGPAERA